MGAAVPDPAPAGTAPPATSSTISPRTASSGRCVGREEAGRKVIGWFEPTGETGGANAGGQLVTVTRDTPRNVHT